MQKKAVSKKNGLPIIVSVGGSLIVPDGIDTHFLSTFKDIIVKHIKRGHRFIIISGGGKTARNYQDAVRAVTSLTIEDVDWIGIHSTRLNAHLMRSIFHTYSHPRVIKNPHEDLLFREKILVAGGWKPGFSTDYDAVLLARNIGAKKIINLSNIDYVYNKDPRKYKNAIPLPTLTWGEFRKLIPKKWSPGLSSPFDPVASKLAQELGIEVAIVNGQKIHELDNYLSGKKFMGTKISD
ncbi:MAG: UMP kinase [Candidatus Taylorbacteria bacterium]